MREGSGGQKGLLMVVHVGQWERVGDWVANSVLWVEYLGQGVVTIAVVEGIDGRIFSGVLRVR